MPRLFMLIALSGMAACHVVIGLGDYGETSGDGGAGGRGGADVSTTTSTGVGAAGGTGGGGGSSLVSLTRRWFTLLGGSGDAYAGGIGYDAVGNLAFCGTHFGDLTDGASTVSDPGGGNIFVGRLGMSGGADVLSSYGDTAGQGCSDLSVDGNNATHIVGAVNGTTTIGTVTFALTLDTVYIARFSAGAFTGNLFVATGASQNHRAFGLAVDPAGGTIAGGFFRGNMNVAGVPVSTSTTVNAGFALRLFSPPDEWVQGLGHVGLGEMDEQAVTTVAMLPNRAFAVGGRFAGSLTHDGAFRAPMSVGADDAFVAIFELDGTLRDIFTWGGTMDDAVTDIVTLADGTIFAVGTYGSEITFGTTTLTQPNGTGIFVVRMSETGEVAWVRAIDAAGNQRGTAIAVDDSENLFLVGTTVGPVDVGGIDVSITASGDTALVWGLTPNGEARFATAFEATDFARPDDVAVDPMQDGGFSVAVTFEGELSAFGMPDAVSQGVDVAIISMMVD